jgi:hypothetical protein
VLERRDMNADDFNPKAKKPWVTPKVILSDPMSGVSVNNKGTETSPDNRVSLLTSTVTS